MDEINKLWKLKKKKKHKWVLSSRPICKNKCWYKVVAAVLKPKEIKRVKTPAGFWTAVLESSSQVVPHIIFYFHGNLPLIDHATEELLEASTKGRNMTQGLTLHSAFRSYCFQLWYRVRNMFRPSNIVLWL